MARENPLDRLTPKRRAFVQAYRGSAQGNATAAARSAGYAHPGAEGHRLLRNADVCAAIRSIADREECAAVADREEREAFLSATMRDPKEATRDRIKSCELLGKMEGDFIKRVEVADTTDIRRPGPNIEGRSTEDLIAFLRTGRLPPEEDTVER